MRGKNSQSWQCRACKKRSYGSQGRAEETIERVVAAGGFLRRAYPCPYGNGWHTTKQEERKKTA